MSFEIHDAVRADVRLLILLAGGTGSGKTESAMRLATGLAGGQPFCVIDTENGRALHKADDYAFKHIPFDEPFSPERYTEAIQTADAAGFPVIIVDSGSHEYDGVGGVLDSQEQEFERMGRKEGARMASWIAPKARHKRFVQTLLRTRAHVILCLRAQDQVEIVKVNGKTEVQPKQTLTGAQGWVPIVEKRLPFEATISLLLLQDSPGVPVPIKLERRHSELVFTDVPLDEATGERLAAWAKGSDAGAHPPASVAEAPTSPRADGTSLGASAPLLTDDQRKVLDELRRGYSLEQLVATFARDRGVSAADVVAETWVDLREQLTGAQADSWIERMSARAPAGATA